MNPGSHRAFVGLGSNLSGPLGQPVDYLDAAIDRLADCEGLYVQARSTYYTTKPWGNEDQPAFVNAVVEIHSSISPQGLLETLLAIEENLGRRRSEKWGPRLIDLDLLCFDELQQQSETLELPHPHMHERAFVLVPLLELEPDFLIPGKGRAKEILDSLGDEQSVTRV